MSKNEKKAEERFGNYKLTNKKVIYIDPETKEESVIAKHLKIQSILENLENGEIRLKLEFWYRGQMKIEEIARSQLTSYELPKLLDTGLDVFDHKAKKVISYLSVQEEYAPLEYNHSHVGWAVHEGKPVYKHLKAINTDGSLTSSYIGEEPPLKSTGTLEKWNSLINQEVIGTPTLELALVMGFSSVIVGLINIDGEIDSLVFHLWGDSTKGKTTAAKLAVSPFGKPSTTEGLINTWNGTKNSLISKVKNNHGIPFVVDEASVNSMKDFTQMTYQLASGIEKSRLTKEAKLRKPETWATTIISTAEKSLVSNSSQNVGQLMRVFEFEEVTWTKDAPNADRLCDGITLNYGHAGPLFAEHVAGLEEEALVTKWHEWTKWLYKRIEESQGTDRFTHRIANKLSILLLTADLVKEGLGLQLNIDGIADLLLEQNAQTADLRDIGGKAMQLVIGQIIEHKSKFEKEHTPGDFDASSYECWGRLKHVGNQVEVSVLPHKFREILQKCGFEDEKVVLSNWKAKGYLIHDKGKNQKKTTVHNADEKHKHKDKRTPTICFRVPRQSLSLETDAQPARNRPQPMHEAIDEAVDQFLENNEQHEEGDPS
ncbi:DUF927 domain-containing protein [Salimicrobium flavidum]|uniref:DUF927 domain-containing protein n=1 Tax=Salimicrobium flavidum TaxID=570947 RepID=A0A1N7IWN9_9BACI|nr:DUF927 domain-containing protein [Salimicrobium flavidum]SIS41522.1 protein of unknown function [Salimicrobium flavidum]